MFLGCTVVSTETPRARRRQPQRDAETPPGGPDELQPQMLAAQPVEVVDGGVQPLGVGHLFRWRTHLDRLAIFLDVGLNHASTFNIQPL
jgi:hypothetical protein